MRAIEVRAIWESFATIEVDDNCPEITDIDDLLEIGFHPSADYAEWVDAQVTDANAPSLAQYHIGREDISE